MWNFIRGTNTRTPCVFLGNQAVMIKPDTGVDAEISNVPCVLHECRLRAPGRLIVEMKILGNVAIENANGTQPIRDNVKVQILPDRREPALHTSFQLMLTVVCRKAAGHIPFSKAAVLRRPDWCGQCIRPEAGIRVASHGSELPQHVRREDVTVRYLAKNFVAIAILALSCRFLKEFVRH